MKILILNGSPRPKGNTAAMIEAYKNGAESVGHMVTVFDVCRMNIKGCLACEYCHTKIPGWDMLTCRSRKCVSCLASEMFPLRWNNL